MAFENFKLKKFKFEKLGLRLHKDIPYLINYEVFFVLGVVLVKTIWCRAFPI